MKVLRAWLLLALLGLVYSQIPARCRSPPVWRAFATQFDHMYGHVRRFDIVYDEYNKRKVIIEDEYNPGPGSKFFEYLILNNVDLMYTVDFQRQTCTKSIPPAWRTFGIPTNATFEREVTIGGLPYEQIEVTEWSDKVPSKEEVWLGVFSSRTCFPIREAFFNSTNKEESVSTDWYNIVSGIPDPNAFIPPSICDNAKWAKPPKRFYW